MTRPTEEHDIVTWKCSACGADGVSETEDPPPGWEPRDGAPRCERCAEHIMQFFAHEHLPAHLAAVSKPFGDLARTIVTTLPFNPERIVALRKLLESKDAAVRARIAKDR
jgi:hypothetical protein